MRDRLTTVARPIPVQMYLVYTTVREPDAYYKAFVSWLDDDNLRVTDDELQAWQYTREEALDAADHLSDVLSRPFRIKRCTW